MYMENKNLTFPVVLKVLQTRNKRKPLGIRPLSLLCTIWLIVALSLFVCRRTNEVSGACNHAHNNTNDTCTISQQVNVTLGEQTSVPHTNINYNFNGAFYPNFEFRHGGLGVTWGHIAIPNPYLEQPPYTSYLDYRL